MRHKAILVFMLFSLDVCANPDLKIHLSRSMAGAEVPRAVASQLDESRHRAALQLERVAIIDDDRYFSTKLNVIVNTSPPHHPAVPETIEEAIVELFNILPTEMREFDYVKLRECHESIGSSSFDAFMANCKQTACDGLPIVDRDPACTFLSRLNMWMQKHWLGGTCLVDADRSASSLYVQLASYGVRTCSGMSMLLMGGFLLKLAGMQTDIPALVRLTIAWESGK